jgi:hypothetical protein
MAMTQGYLFAIPHPTPCDCGRGVWAVPYLFAGCLQERWSCEPCQDAGLYSTASKVKA